MLELAIRERYVTCDIVVTYLRYAATGACTGCCARGAGFPLPHSCAYTPLSAPPPRPQRRGDGAGGGGDYRELCEFLLFFTYVHKKC